MQKNSLKNIISFIISKPSRLKELAGKIFVRLSSGKEKEKDIDWIKERKIPFEEWASAIDSDAWEESVLFSSKLKEDAKIKLASIPYSMGGGGIYPVLYFLARTRKPSVIVETGVAAGYSSKTFLSAIKANSFGKLYSSDFPYFRLPNPEKYVGILVDDDLKNNWELFLDGDKANLPRILARVDKIDLFHYDSDKSYHGREIALRFVKDKLSADALVIFDDIQDNNHFRDFVLAHTCNYSVFEFGGKFVGLISHFKS